MAAPTPFRSLRINQVTGAIVSSAMHVHSILGPGLLESAYQACLAHELRKRGLAVAAQVGLPVVFDGEKIELGYRMDLVVENSVIVEEKRRRNSPSPPGATFVVHEAERDWSWSADQFLYAPFARWNQAHGRREGLAEVALPRVPL